MNLRYREQCGIRIMSLISNYIKNKNLWKNYLIR